MPWNKLDAIPPETVAIARDIGCMFSRYRKEGHSHIYLRLNTWCPTHQRVGWVRVPILVVLMIALDRENAVANWIKFTDCHMHKSHLCHNSMCTNPFHVVWETPRNNIDRRSCQSAYNNQLGPSSRANQTTRDKAIRGIQSQCTHTPKCYIAGTVSNLGEQDIRDIAVSRFPSIHIFVFTEADPICRRRASCTLSSTLECARSARSISLSTSSATTAAVAADTGGRIKTNSRRRRSNITEQRHNTCSWMLCCILGLGSLLSTSTTWQITRRMQMLSGQGREHLLFHSTTGLWRSVVLEERRNCLLATTRKMNSGSEAPKPIRTRHFRRYLDGGAFTMSIFSAAGLPITTHIVDSR